MIDDIHICLIWAMARKRVIGRGNTLPWRLRSEMQHFKRTTMGKPAMSASGLLAKRVEAILAGINTVKETWPTQRSHSSSLRVRASVSNMMGMPSRTG